MAITKRQIDLEREYHESYDKRRDTSRLIVRTYRSDLFREAEAFYISAVGALDGLRLLDYGCGTGESTSVFCQQGANVTGFDISHRRIMEAQERCNALRAGFVQCAAEFLPFADATIDAVMGKQILHHLDLAVAIPEVARVLKPGGHAVFLEPLGHNPLLEGYRRLTPHLRSPTERALRMKDLRYIASYFQSWRHREFCFLSVVPALAQSVMSDRVGFERLSTLLRKVDSWLLRVLPCLGRYYWETVIVVQK